MTVPCRSMGVVRKGKEQEKEEEVGMEGRTIPALQVGSSSLRLSRNGCSLLPYFLLR